MLAIALALAASMSVGTADFLAGSQARRHGLWTVIIVSQLTGSAWTAAVVLARGEPVPAWPAPLWSVLAGITAVFAIWLGYRALQIGVMAIAGPLMALSIVIPVGFGLSRGERPSSLQTAGIALALLGVMLASSERTAGRRVAPSKRSVTLALAAALFIGINMVCYAQAAHQDVSWSVFMARATSTILFAAAYVSLRPRLPRLTATSLVPLIAIGVFDTGSNALFSLASTKGYLSVVSVLSSIYPVFTAALAYIVLEERLAPWQLLGVGSALAGVGLLAVA